MPSPMEAKLIHPVRLPMEELLQQCTVRPGRRGGPGGQHRNKTETAVTIRHDPTGVEGQASERRSQLDNRRNAVKRLRRQLALEVRTASGADEAPSALWQSRCRNGKIVCSAEHDDYAVLLAEALDVLADRQGHLDSSAAQLGCTVSQLMKFLGKEPAAIVRLNEWRRQAGLPPRSV